MIQSLARASFNPTNTSQKVKAKTYTPLLADLYREGTATVQLLGLQRVGFNSALLQTLQKSYSRRESARGAEKRSADEMGESAFGGKGGGGEVRKVRKIGEGARNATTYRSCAVPTRDIPALVMP